MSDVRLDEDSTVSLIIPLSVFCLCIALFGFIAGSFLMYRDVFPAPYLAQSYQGGLALLDKATGYQDPLATDLWHPVRTDEKGVTIYDPERAANGLTLYTSGHAQEAFLMDMEGKVVHEWSLPYSREIGRASCRERVCQY